MAKGSAIVLLALALTLSWIGAVGRALGESPVAARSAAEPEAVEFFEKTVRPILAERCQTCHGTAKQKGGLRLDSRASILQGGETGPAVVPGKPGESLLIEAVQYGDDLKMPPRTRLTAAEVASLSRWVEMGAPWGKETPAVSNPAPDAGNGFDLKARRAAHWAWRPVEPRTPPEVKDTSWPRDPIDRFLLARMEGKGLSPSPDADRRVILRRLTFDLTGLPPTPEEVETYLSDTKPDADQRLVDRLLASPRFGERWGRHWLDLVRYAESRGHEFDATIPNAWQYRDYVIRALNADVPYDRFVTEHIAGDLLEQPRIDPVTGANESLVGTGFWFLGEEVHSPVDIRQDETDRMDNRLDVMTKTFLGLTVACARCHDHKFDAISQRDYYALSGFLISSGYRQARFATIENERHDAESLQALRDAARARVLSLAAHAAGPGIDRFADDLLAARSLLLGGEFHGEIPDRTKAWSIELNLARSDRNHFLHGFAVVHCDATAVESRVIAERIKAMSSSVPADAGGKTERVIVDFGSTPSLSRLQDGFAFGLRPVYPGDLRLAGKTEGGAGLGLYGKAAARRDPAFRSLSLSEGTARDHGRLGTWDRAGQTLRTPEFTVGSGHLWYLAKGAGRAYAAVNAHLIVDGPLHRKVMTEWTKGDQGWRWVRHDLTDYQGNRAHIEFSPSGTDNLEIARVVESDRMPGLVEQHDDLLARLLSAPDVDSPEGLARSYQSHLKETARRMEADSPALPGDEAFARVADWVIKNPALFDPLTSEVTRTAVLGEAERLRGAEESYARIHAAGTATAPAMVDGTGVNEHLLIRGSSKTPGPEVPRRFLEAIVGDSPLVDPSGADAGSGRLALARQMVGPSNPFASRVIVNRAWYHLFGRGIVASVDNFGVLGDEPTHPEILDHLADRFVNDGWSLKRLIRTLVLTRAYRMSSRPEPRGDGIDPQNRLFHRMPIRRLEAEPIRDSILAVSRRLDSREFGPSVPIHLTDFMEGRGRPKTSGPLDGEGRRSIYLAVRRNFLTPMMLDFDAPIPFTTIGRRNVSNVPAQALILMNDPFVVEQAGRWADRVLAAAREEPSARVNAMYRTAFARPPEPNELAEALEFLESQGREFGLTGAAWEHDRRVWADLAHVLFNSKEFVFVD